MQTERKRLEGLGKLWESCQSQMPKPPMPEGQEPPKAANFEEYLRGEEGFAAALAAPMDPKTRTVLAINARLAEKLDPEEARAILACNLMRNLLGLSALAIDPKLCDAARDHSKDMETLKFFAHESPVAGKKTPWDRAKRFGTTARAENIAMGYHDGRAVNEGWFHSPGPPQEHAHGRSRPHRRRPQRRLLQRGIRQMSTGQRLPISTAITAPMLPTRRRFQRPRGVGSNAAHVFENLAESSLGQLFGQHQGLRILRMTVTQGRDDRLDDPLSGQAVLDRQIGRRHQPFARRELADRVADDAEDFVAHFRHGARRHRSCL